MGKKAKSDVLLVIDFDKASGLHVLTSASHPLNPAPEPSEKIQCIVDAVQLQYPHLGVMFHKDSNLADLDFH